MLRRKPRELTTDDAPDSIAPWEMLEDAEIATQSARLREAWPDRNLIAFARRMDKDALACFDKGPDGAGKAVMVVEGMTEQAYPGFGAWFDAALADARGSGA